MILREGTFPREALSFPFLIFKDGFPASPRKGFFGSRYARRGVCFLEQKKGGRVAVGRPYNCGTRAGNKRCDYPVSAADRAGAGEGEEKRVDGW